MSPSEVVRLAHRAGASAIALTDHDTTAGVDEAMAEGAGLGVEVIPGIELGTDSARGDLHLVGLWVDHRHDELNEVTARFRESRIGRAKKIVSILNGLGLTSLTYERIKEIAGDASIGRPHIAKALLEAGYIQSIQEAFDRYLADDGPADVGRDKFEPIPAIELVHRAGGIAIAAHPLEGKRIDPLIPELAAAGLDGMEVYYYGYDAEKTRFLAELADANGLAHSGGTDFHGFPMNGEAEIGNWPGTLAVPAFVLPRLRERAEKRRSRVALAALART
jgi:hypothetical protein